MRSDRAAENTKGVDVAETLHSMREEELKALSDFLFNVVRPIACTYQDAEDHVQEAFLKALRARRDLISVRAWTYTVGRMEAINARRKAARRERHFRRIEVDLAMMPGHFSTRRNLERLCEALQIALLKLPSDQQVVITDQMNGASRAETAGTLGVSETKVCKLFHQACSRLRSVLDY